MSEVLAFLALALALGFKHSYDADHLAAVSNLLLRSRSLRHTTAMSASWAVGHTLTASVVTAAFFVAGAAVIGDSLEKLELAVAAMLVLIGALALLWEYGMLQRMRAWLERAGILHQHRHDHDGVEHGHAHAHARAYRDHGTMFGIGIVHGLASNDELLVLLVAALGIAATDVAGLTLGVVAFGIGVVVGMVVFGIGLTYPVMRWGRERVRHTVTVVAAVLSIAYGILIMLGMGGFNLLGG